MLDSHCLFSFPNASPSFMSTQLLRCTVWRRSRSHCEQTNTPFQTEW